MGTQPAVRIEPIQSVSGDAKSRNAAAYVLQMLGLEVQVRSVMGYQRTMVVETVKELFTFSYLPTGHWSWQRGWSRPQPITDVEIRMALDTMHRYTYGYEKIVSYAQPRTKKITRKYERRDTQQE